MGGDFFKIMDFLNHFKHFFSSGGEIIRPDGNWSQFLPTFKPQKIGPFDSKSCVTFGTLACLKSIENAKYGILNDYSERFLAIVSGTDASGNSPHQVADAIKYSGLVSQETLPFNDQITSLAAFYTPNPMAPELLSQGKVWLKNNDFDHKWVITPFTLFNRTGKMVEALKRSTLGASVFAWSKGEDGLYIHPKPFKDNHFGCIFHYEQDVCWYFFDSYEMAVKKLAWNYPFAWVKEYEIIHHS